MNVRILRLKNGDDIICDVEKDDDTYYVNAPMIMWMENNGHKPKLCMDHWLPIQVVEDNCVTLKMEEVLCTMLPNEQLTEYYTNQILELNSVLSAKDASQRMSDEELIETILAIEEGDGATFH